MLLPDEHWMWQAIQIGETVRAKTGDNPHVGCVLVEKNQLLVKGWTHLRALIGKLALMGIDFEKIFTWLEQDGVKKFENSWNELINTVTAKVSAT